jgi:ferric-dicitrate binding protein FerR (iron transport regulator)
MLNKEEQKRLEDYLNGLADREESLGIARLFSEGESNVSLKQMLFNEWEKIRKIDETDDENLEPVLDRLHHIISLSELEKRQSPLRKIIQFYIKIAAILLLPVLVSGVALFSYFRTNDKLVSAIDSDATIYAPIGSRISFQLPDGTSGMLNSGSYLKYSIPFGNRRHVSLSGEAWFEVKSDPENPFYITSGESTIKVSGTKFNLSAYPAENCIEIVLDEGNIEFRPNKADDFIILKPTERVVVRNGDIRMSFVDPEKYHAWTDGRLVFKNDTMAEVVRRLERWYNVKISIVDEELDKYSFRATFQDDSIEEVLKFLALTSPIRYKILPRSLNPDGSYKKQEITISKKK